MISFLLDLQYREMILVLLFCTERPPENPMAKEVVDMTTTNNVSQSFLGKQSIK